ncbi:ABC transporter ATP-binding protein [Arsukibacterium sp.]|uniref:ABC transporter ATP-binding protein n=1 Tax=Arsukibacterium sp. TaxID=1977258 RepID=UPI00299E65D3|nr:ATP-binding cassette domain-containing protein [Arsukibacterium sp.]MDX1536496.1 ATP-binding cassette domain-containing protein [Arsukibacterium sp.]
MNSAKAATDRAPVIRIRKLENRFGSQVVHSELDLDLHQGEILAVVGGSGSGKSVLMRSILGLLRPDSGTIEVFQNEITGTEALQQLMARHAGVLFQEGALFSSLTVLENVELPLKTRWPKLSVPLRQQLALSKLGLAGLAAATALKMPSELSGGMRKRVALARALVLEPEILFLDEPTAGLDPIGAAEFDNLLRTLQQALQFTVFMITHDLDTLYAIADRVAVIADQKIVTTASPDEVAKHSHPWIRDYFTGPRARSARQQRADTTE